MRMPRPGAVVGNRFHAGQGQGVADTAGVLEPDGLVAGQGVVGTGDAPENTDTTTVAHPADLAKQARVLASRLPDAKATRSADAAVGW